MHHGKEEEKKGKKKYPKWTSLAVFTQHEIPYGALLFCQHSLPVWSTQGWFGATVMTSRMPEAAAAVYYLLSSFNLCLI